MEDEPDLRYSHAIDCPVRSGCQLVHYLIKTGNFITKPEAVLDQFTSHPRPLRSLTVKYYHNLWRK